MPVPYMACYILDRELAAEFRRRGFRVEENVEWLPGRPDLILPRRKVAIFVHGCFWHGCPKHFTLPKHNRSWWRAKIEGNKVRDRRRAATLRRQGWHVYTVWEHRRMESVADLIARSTQP
jgi:DNA mismatch endonuclease (patch repair protein)